MIVLILIRIYNQNYSCGKRGNIIIMSCGTVGAQILDLCLGVRTDLL